jgi:hypothetical protein
MIIYQLELLRNVFSQHEAVSALEDFADTEDTIEMLSNMLKKDEIYYGVRCHVARFLGKFASEKTDFKHMQVLLEWYRSEFFTPDQMRVKPHDFHDVSRHFVQLEVIKALSIIRDGQNYTPKAVVDILLCMLTQANNSSSNMYNDDHYNAEVELALGRIRPENEERYRECANAITGKLKLHATIPSFCNIISNAGYLALTAIALRTDITPDIPEMRTVVLDRTSYFEARASVFRDLLFLALLRNRDVTFSDLVADIRWLAMHDQKEMAGCCLREMHRFVLNSVRVGDEDKFQSYLLALPEDLSREDLIKLMTGGPHKLEVVETLWEILTIHGQHHRILRSEAFRAYVTLYGEKLPHPYAEKTMNGGQVDLTADRSGGCVFQVDMPRPPRAQSVANMVKDVGVVRKMKLKFTEPVPPPSGVIARSASQPQIS